MSAKHDLVSFSSVADDELLDRLKAILKGSRRTESELVAHIGEVDARRLYAEQGSPSMFQYCVDVLSLSESEAYRRIRAARLSRRYPEILDMLSDGRLHLCGIAILAEHVTDENHRDVLERAAHKSKRELELLVASLTPRPDVAPSIRKYPVWTPKPCVALIPAAPLTRSPKPGSDEERKPPMPAPAPVPVVPENRPRVEPLAPARYKVQFTASEELRDKFERLQALMPGRALDEVIDAAVSEKLQRLESKRYGKTEKPRTTLEDADTSSGRRSIAQAVKRFVWERDGGQCTFFGPDGRRCAERDELEFHHDEPHALGGNRDPMNLRLLCKTHNLMMAERDFGKEVMERYRKADRVQEPAPIFELSPDTVAGLTTSATARMS